MDKFQRYGIRIPKIVQQATKLAESLGFPIMPEGRPIGFKGPASACIPGMGDLLRGLAAARPGGKIVEFGTGAGVGTAWLTSGLTQGARLISAEIDPALAQAAAELFKSYPNVEIRVGDAMSVLADTMPCDLLFMDSTPRDYLAPENWGNVIELVHIGGQIVFDDLAPLEQWPPEWDDLIDLKREFAFNNPRAIGTAIRVGAIQTALTITRTH